MFVKLVEKYNTSNTLHGKSASSPVTLAQSKPMFGFSTLCYSAATLLTSPQSFGTVTTVTVGSGKKSAFIGDGPSLIGGKVSDISGTSSTSGQ